jgi:hypothetical protein
MNGSLIFRRFWAVKIDRRDSFSIPEGFVSNLEATFAVSDFSAKPRAEIFEGGEVRTARVFSARLVGITT